VLQGGFNRMAVGLRERERLRDLFGRHVGEDVARQALESQDVELGGESREAAVLFVDVIGSTRYVDFDTTKAVYPTAPDKCHISHVVADTGSWDAVQHATGHARTQSDDKPHANRNRGHYSFRGRRV